MLALALASSLAAQNISLSLPDELAQTGDVVSLDLRAQDFDEVVSMQFSLRWDVAVMTYTDFELVDLDNVAIGAFEASDGVLRFSWFDQDGVGRTLPDGAAIVRLRFTVVGLPGAFTDVSFSGTPLAIQIFRVGDEPGEFVPLTLVPDDGSVTVVSESGFALSTTHVACQGEATGSITLAATGSTAGLTYQWSGPAGFTASTPDISALLPGEYSLTVTDAQGTLVYEATTTVSEPPALLLEAAIVTDAGCDDTGGSTALSATGGTPPYTYSLGGDSNASGMFADLVPGAYLFTLTDAQGCTLQDSLTVGAALAPQPQLPGPYAICGPVPVLLVPGDFANYLWSTGETTATISVAEPGNYSVTVTNEAGCTGTAAATVTLQSEGPALLLTAEADTACPGEALQLQAAGADTYEWIDTSSTLAQLSASTAVVTPLFTTTYALVGSNACGIDTATVIITVMLSEATAGPDTCIALGGEARLMASGGLSYFWDNAPFPLSRRDIPNPLTSPEDSTVYRVTIIDAFGCTVRDSVTVTVATDILGTIKAVNTITPNGDGKNDVLEFLGAEKFGLNTLRVYNRWGNIVYQKVNYQLDEERFDGTFQGQPLPAGVYFYVLSFRTAEIKQKLMIVR